MDFLGVFIKDDEHSQGPTVHRGIGDKVPRPDMTAVRGLGRQSCRVSSAYQPTFGGRHPQPIDAPQSLHLALTHAPAFLPQCDFLNDFAESRQKPKNAPIETFLI